ncbi:glutathione S-transferase family protein [Parasphingorhabdus sp.]|uniref:glutathione S-transferase family protein n=1 Tax=Parasphingorhabdus sp. TaxID=2709688 RepID=UPI0032679DEE
MTVKFYTNPMSRGQISRWALHEAGADYEQILLDYGTSMKADDYLQINPMGKVPAIEHRGKVVTEGAAICAYLADAFPAAGLAPNAKEQADYYRWMFFAAGPLESAITNRSLGFEIAPDKEMTAGYGSYDRVVDVLDTKFQVDDYVCGSRFTMADVYVGAQITWGTQFGTLPQRDSFLAYVKRLTNRDAYIAAKAIDDTLITENS